MTLIAVNINEVETAGDAVWPLVDAKYKPDFNYWTGTMLVKKSLHPTQPTYVNMTHKQETDFWKQKRRRGLFRRIPKYWQSSL